MKRKFVLLSDHRISKDFSFKKLQTVFIKVTLLNHLFLSFDYLKNVLIL